MNERPAKLVSFDLVRALSTVAILSLAGLVPRCLAAEELAAEAMADRRGGFLLQTVDDSPPVQMLVPGFTVKQLPLQLTNINNVKYRQDGKLVALAYSGNVYLLSDTTGDGLEDTAEVFWENDGRLRGPVGMALTPEGYAHGTGVIVASKGKCSLIVDTTGDDRADRQIVIADGWEEIAPAVDAVGVAFDPQEGSIYFGLGTAQFNNPYQLDEQGQAHYDLESERGTILRISPDFKTREIVCTGIRFPVGMAINRHGDLFCTEQEGATWLPNGNPYDQLLHIQPGRHYGFPPRHPDHLPGVIDEPGTFDYGPQHQATTGIHFNEPVHGGPVFGPKWWAGNALLTGYSRGKLYRTELVKTKVGYVARNQILANLNKLTVDACVSLQGHLVIAVHSGQPDWGTGPEGEGTLYKVFFSRPEHPQPVAVWAEGPQEVHIAFDRPIDPQLLQNLVQQTTITYGRFVRAGDRFEVLRPGYAVVEQQMQTPRYDLPVLGGHLTSDHRTIMITTAPHPRAVHYSITLPGMGRTISEQGGDELLQEPAIDLDYQLTGVRATWTADGAEEASWLGWLPHLDLTVARKLTDGSASHTGWWDNTASGGTLTMQTQLDLVDMLRPAVQMGSTIDYEWPEETVTLVFSSPHGISIESPEGRIEYFGDRLETCPATAGAEGHNRVEWTVVPEPGSLFPLKVTVDAEQGEPSLDVAFYTNEDPRLRPLRLHRMLLPWARLDAETEDSPPRREIPELAGGDWEAGWQLFFGDEALCSRCHAMRGEGGRIGPDLSNLVHRDYASVHRDISDPNFGLNPDYLTYSIELADGRVMMGTVRTEGEQLHIGSPEGEETVVDTAKVDALHPQRHSLMPDDLAERLGPEKLRHLMTYLLNPPPGDRDGESGHDR